MADHTPGPWETFDDEIVAARTDVHIADVALEDGTNPTEWQANLRLMAAAPELLDALKAVLAQFDVGNLVRNTDSDGCSDWAIKAAEPLRALAGAKTAIAKAEGR